MEKIVTIDGKEVKMKSSAATILLYRARFNEDLTSAMRKLMSAYESDEQMTNADLTIFLNLSYIMAKQADPTIADSPEEWLDEFEMFSIYEVIPQIVELWGANQKTTAIPKKK